MHAPGLGWSQTGVAAEGGCPSGSAPADAAEFGNGVGQSVGTAHRHHRGIFCLMFELFLGCCCTDMG